MSHVAVNNQALHRQSISTEVQLVDRSTPYLLTVEITPKDLIIQTNEWNDFVNSFKGNASFAHLGKSLLDELVRALQPQNATVKLSNKDDTTDVVQLTLSFKEPKAAKGSPTPKKRRSK